MRSHLSFDVQHNPNQDTTEVRPTDRCRCWACIFRTVLQAARESKSAFILGCSRVKVAYQRLMETNEMRERRKERRLRARTIWEGDMSRSAKHSELPGCLERDWTADMYTLLAIITVRRKLQLRPFRRHWQVLRGGFTPSCQDCCLRNERELLWNSN